LHRSERGIIALVLAASRPVTAGELAKRLKVDYSMVKRLARELIRWRILDRLPGGSCSSRIPVLGAHPRRR
jgi:DNA-binding MarR family transcriptional regulator